MNNKQSTVITIIVCVALIVTVGYFIHTYMQYTEARSELNETLDEYSKSLEKLNITTEKYLEFIFTKNAFDMGYYERISPDCYANDAGETYCKGVKP